jgi:hypothetical protein
MDIENHPIPQDITGFQFKLIGSMTIKQFAYLAGGFVLAWVFYISPLLFIIKIIIAAACAGIGASLAFLPIDGRPMDIMIVNFIKAVLKPTQYVYQQTNTNHSQDAKNIHEFNKKRQSISDMSDKQLQDFLSALPKEASAQNKKEMVYFKNQNQAQPVSPMAQALPGYIAQHAYSTLPPAPTTTGELPPLNSGSMQATRPQITADAPLAIQQNTKPQMSEITQAPTDIKKPINIPIQTETSQAAIDSGKFLETHQKVLELQKNLNDMQLQKQQLEEKLTSLQKQVNTDSRPVFSAGVANQEPQQSRLIHSIPKNMTKSIGLISTPEFPNVISGIVKDPRGNPLSNILVEVKDLQGNAIRAFKTNALGQFASATALMNGDYTIEFDDPRGQNKFEMVGFKASGEIILPIEVLSVDTREEIRRSLFN